jgi:hypothetical protein
MNVLVFAVVSYFVLPPIYSVGNLSRLLTPATVKLGGFGGQGKHSPLAVACMAPEEQCYSRQGRCLHSGVSHVPN